MRQSAEDTVTSATVLYGLVDRPDAAAPIRLGPKGGRFLFSCQER